jgi:hypothetical protein
MARVKREILPQMIANGTPILRGPHITLFLERWLQAGRVRDVARQDPERAAA